MTAKAKADIGETQAEIEELRADIKALEEKVREEVERTAERWTDALDEIKEVKVSPRRIDVDVELFALAWAPHWRISCRSGPARQQTRIVPAYTAGQ
jgi:hypothetical protein